MNNGLHVHTHATLFVFLLVNHLNPHVLVDMFSNFTHLALMLKKRNTTTKNRGCSRKVIKHLPRTEAMAT